MPSILLADANPTNRKIVELSFAEEAVEVISFSDGLKARDFLSDNVIDVVLADVALPAIDGYELCRLVKANPSLQHVPVILMAGRFQMVDLERAEEAGYHSQITKPVEPASLVDLVKDLLSGAGTASDGSSPPASEAGVQESTHVKSESAMIFQIPVGDQPQRLVFSLKANQCRPSAQRVRREAAPLEAGEAEPSHEEAAVPEPEHLQEAQEASRQASLESSGEDASGEGDSASENEPRGDDQVDRVVARLAGKLPDIVRAILEEERHER
ncbi:MAG TPA: response regulator [Acidobacteriota bacterium]|nr:response regulator [Acidobacteriota bacterium]